MFATMTQVRTYDGIDREEAVLLAQGELMFRGKQKQYRFDQPEILREDSDRWVLQFHPLVPTFSDRHKVPIMQVTVDKTNGKVRAREVWPEL